MNWLRTLLLAPLSTSHAEQLRAGFGALIGIFVAGAISTWWLGPIGDLPLLIAPMGASAVLLLGVPASPLAQPWAIVGGNIIAAIVGVSAARWIGAPLLAATVAVALALMVMALLRCVHPPAVQSR